MIAFIVKYERAGKRSKVRVLATSGVRAMEAVLVARHGLVAPNGFTAQDSIAAFCARHRCKVSARPA